MVDPAKNTICLWYDRDAEDAARFYAKSIVRRVHRARETFRREEGDVLTVDLP
jgi:2-polyprenyl-6-hydroxyphenyl methylase/3-demethylubiquinone-9 3-methyltransferase